MASPPLNNQAAGGPQGQSAPGEPMSQASHNRLTSSSSSVLPGIFLEPSHSRSNTSTTNISSGDENDDQKRPRSTGRYPSLTRLEPRARSSPNSSISPTLSPQPLHAQALNSGHRSSQQLPATLQGEGLELHERFPNHNGAAGIDGEGQYHAQRQSSAGGEGEAINSSLFPGRHRVHTGDSLHAPFRTESWLSNPRQWPKRSVYFVHSSMTTRVMYGVLTLVVALFAAASAAYFAYRTYVMQLWQSEHDYFDWCRQAVQEYPTQECASLLKTKLPPPPFQYSRASQRTNLITRNLGTPVQRIPVSVWSIETICTIFMVAACMLMLQIVMTSVYYTLWQLIPNYRSVFRACRALPWSVRHQHADPFSLANVRIEPQFREVRERRFDHGTEDTETSSVAQYRRIMPVLENLRNKMTEEKKRQQETDSVYDVPSWKNKNLQDLIPEDGLSALEHPIVDSEDEGEQDGPPIPTQIGDAFKGTMDNDRITQSIKRSDSNTVSSLRKRLRSKAPRMFSINSRSDSWDEVQPALTALGADNDDDEKNPGKRHQNIVISGHVAVGLAQAGAALASTAGGAIGKNVLVQLVEKESERLHNILQSGISRTRTNEEIDYEQDRDDFVHGRRPSRQLRRRTRTRSTTAD